MLIKKLKNTVKSKPYSRRRSLLRPNYKNGKSSVKQLNKWY